ncbi:MAG TPA: hypothetical protein VG937_28295 [Polyangiaceae bacterium]|nr:hypothetical protein [Polyangiaceae bacterium]
MTNRYPNLFPIAGGWIFSCPEATGLPLYHSTKSSPEAAAQEIIRKDPRATAWLKPTAGEPQAPAKKPAKSYTVAELQAMVDQLRAEIEEEKRKLGIKGEARVSAAQTVHSDPRLAEIDSQLAGYKPVVINSAYKQTFTSCPQVAVKSPCGDYDSRLRAKLDSMTADESNPHVTETSTRQVFHR